MSRFGTKRRAPVGPILWRRERGGYVRQPFKEGKRFERHAWRTVRRNYPRYEGWIRIEQLRLESGKQPDNVLWNEETDEFVVAEMKDVGELSESEIRKVRAYMDEVGAAKGFVPVAWDTEVPRRVRSLAKRLGIIVRRTSWRR